MAPLDLNYVSCMTQWPFYRKSRKYRFLARTIAYRLGLFDLMNCLFEQVGTF